MVGEGLWQIEADVPVPMRDGITLAIDLYRPVPAEPEHRRIARSGPPRRGGG